MDCLDEQVLLQLVHRLLPAEEATECARHLEGCTRCRERFVTRAHTPGETSLGSLDDTPSLGPTGALDSGPSAPAALARTRATLARGASVGRYLVLDKLGQGGMGEVYAAFDPQLGRRVALKLLLTTRRDADAEDAGSHARERLLREAQAMAQLSHPNVLPVFDVGEHEGRVFIAMELVEGQTLRAWQKAQRRPWREVLRPFLDAGRGLAAAHRAGLVHRDFKPDNVLLSNDGRVYVMDFGLARAGGESSGGASGVVSGGAGEPSLGRGGTGSLPTGLLGTRLTLDTGVIGTPGYMSPEQIRNTELDGRADVFAFCVSLYAALYGQRPFVGATGRDVLTATLEGQVPPPPRGSKVPAWLHRVVLKGLAADRDQRFASMDALLAALQDDPAVRVRRGAVAAAALVLLASAVAVPRAATARKAAACEAEGQAFAQVWTPARRAQLERAFRATGVAYAQDALRTVTGALDAYARGWAEQRTGACLATRVEGRAPPSELTLRSACLDARLREATALTDVLATADARTVEKSVTAVARLSPLATCADLGALLREVRPPDSPALAAQVEDHRRTLARAKALYNSGRMEDTVQLLTPLRAPVHALGYAPLEAEFLLQLGAAQHWFGQTEEAEDSLLSAIAVAEACNHDGVKLDAAAGLLWPYADNAQRARDARVWIRWARALASRMPHQPGALVRILYAESWLHYREKDAAGAVPLMEQAAELSRTHDGKDSPDAALMDNALALMLRETGRFQEARARYEGLLATQTPLLGQDHPLVGIVQANLSGVYVALGEHARALEAARGAQRVFTAAFSPQHPHVARIRTTAAQPLLALGRHAEALQLMDEALPLLEAALGKDNPELVETLDARAEALLALGRPAEALASAQRAHALALTLPDAGKTARQLGATIGLVHLEQGRARQALPLLTAALDEATSGAVPFQVGALSTLRFHVARARWELRQDRPAALALARQALAGLQGPGTERPRQDVQAWLSTHSLRP